MGKMYWFRVGMMILTFVMVVMTMRSLQSTKPTASPLATMILGSGEEQKIVLCTTRVTSLETSSGLRVHESGMKWTRTSAGTEQELDPIAVEKWLSRNCSVVGKKVEPGQNFEPILKLGLVTGESKVLARAGTGEYLWDGLTFISSTLDQALTELTELPASTPHGQK
jgi:hypothetical protein